MKVLIMRHGESSMFAESDAARELTSGGREEVHGKCMPLGDAGITRIISSPILRAQQTANIVLNMINSSHDLELWEELVPDGDPAAIAEKLSDINMDTVLLTTHQPLAGRLVKYLTDEEIPFDTAQICCVTGSELEKHCCRIEWIK